MRETNPVYQEKLLTCSLFTMCYSAGIPFSSDVAIFLTVLLGCAMVCCLIANVRLAWLGIKGSSGWNIQVSPYLLSCGCSDTAMVCIFGPILCSLLTQDNWLISSAMCAFMDCLFLALFWCTTISLLLYNLDRHCLLIQRRLYLDTFGQSRRNTINLILAWFIPFLSSLPYLHARDLLPARHTPMTFLLRKNMLYCVMGTIVLYAIPIVIIIISLAKTFTGVKNKSRHFHRKEVETVRGNITGILREDYQTHLGLIASSGTFVLTATPWVLFQLLKALELNGNATTVHEIALLTILVIGVGMKTMVYVICCGFIRKRFFANLFNQNSSEFTLEPIPVVLFNDAAL